jgi:hypothetical protein
MGSLKSKGKKMATAPKIPRHCKANPTTDVEAEMLEFAGKVEEFVDSRRAKMTDAQRADADARASALLDELRAKR